MKLKKKTNERNPVLPQWAPYRFKELVDNIPCKNYKHILTELMAAEMRVQMLYVGEAIVTAIRNDNAIPENELKIALESLAKYWSDPIAHEKEIFKIQKEMAKNFNITSNTRR